MEKIWTFIQNYLTSLTLNINYIPIWKILIIAGILILTLIFRQVFATLIIRRIEVYTSKTENKFDDELLKVIKRPLGWLIVVTGFWLIKLLIEPELSPAFQTLISDILNLITIYIIAFIVYRIAPILGEILRILTLHTETELDDFLVPYLPKLFQTATIVVVLIKTSEVFLGASAGAIIGLLGGAGVALGLLFKDIIYDWCCTVIIYLDNLYRTGDIIRIPGVDGFAVIQEIGLRSTTLLIATTHSFIKIPNSKMIDGRVINITQDVDKEKVLLGVNTIIKIDGISAQKTALLCQKFREIPYHLENLHNDPCLVIFKGIEGNARVIEVRVFAKEATTKIYWDSLTALHLEILKILEQERIDLLHVFLRTDVDGYKQNLASIN
ncbi:MAG: mechanosensitive ion channel [Nostocaceae cyanobacterium]|nr:mechanosensitive ion channel [Nostocaceae cyanobacterium]